MDYHNAQFWLYLHLEKKWELPTILLQMHAFLHKAPTANSAAASTQEVFLAWESFAAGIYSDSYKQLLEHLQIHAIEVLTPISPNYPKLLWASPYKVPYIFVQGLVTLNHKPALAVVGTRTPSIHAPMVLHYLLQPFLKEVSIWSGMAVGIDTLVHRKCSLQSTHTVAVLGSGVSYPMTSDQQRLKQEILASGGTILSQFLPSLPPLRHHFPMRNRILSGATFTTLLVESRRKGGAMITSELCLKEHKTLWACPGLAHLDTSQGPNLLISTGRAMMAKHPEELYGCLFPQQPTLPLIKAAPVLKNKVVIIVESVLKNQPCNLHELVYKTKLSLREVISAISELETEGILEYIPGGRFFIS
jgi:DNA processing protein